MFSTPAYAQAAGAAAPAGPEVIMMQLLPLVMILVVFYFLLIRPQQKRAKAHQALIAGIKRGDTVVLSNGVIGKVARVEDAEVGVEIATGVTVKVIKGMINDVRTRGEPAAANDAKS